jgi:hypothetical protein
MMRIYGAACTDTSEGVFISRRIPGVMMIPAAPMMRERTRRKAVICPRYKFTRSESPLPNDWAMRVPPAMEKPMANTVKNQMMGRATAGAERLAASSFPRNHASVRLYRVCRKFPAMMGRASFHRRPKVPSTKDDGPAA